MSQSAKSAKVRAEESANNLALAQARQRRDEATAEYEEATRGLNFTKEFHGHNEAIMRDQMATHGERYLAWLRRRAWGEYSLYAIGMDGSPLLQEDAAKELGIDKRRISGVANYYESRGFLRREGKRQYPVISPVLGPSPENSSRSADFSAFLESWKVTHSSDFSELEVARSAVSRIRKVILSDYKKSREQASKAAGTLLEIARPIPDPPLAAVPVLSPFEQSNRRAQAAQAGKNPSDEGQVQSKDQARSFLFSEIARMQKAYPHTTFARPPIDPECEEHQRLVNLILKKLGQHDEEYLVGYVVWVAANFKGLGRNTRQRPPGRSGGPEGLGLLVNWAEDYARIAGEKRQHTHA
jgi:hypothetical protein